MALVQLLTSTSTTATNPIPPTLTGTTTQLSSPSQTHATGLHAYTTLQTTLLARLDIPTIPILPVASLETLPTLLQTLPTPMREPSRPARPPFPGTVTTSANAKLLGMCTATPPLTSLAQCLSTDVFSSLRDLAGAAVMASHSLPTQDSMADADADADTDGVVNGSSARDLDRFAILREQVGDEEVEAMIDFWVEEWIAE